MPYKFKLLSIDGGGVRGIIPAIILAEIEKRTGRRICQLFDLIAGTSTGGILTLGLTKPNPDRPHEPDYTAKKLIDLYQQCGSEVFYEPPLEILAGNLDDLTRPKYSSDHKERVLTKYFTDTSSWASDPVATPIEKALTEVFITSYDIELRRPVFFTSRPEKQETESKSFRKVCTNFTMKDAAMATSAAPTYFKPHRIPTTQTESGFYTLVDGGVFANNPTSLALMEAIIDSKKRQEIKKQPEPTDILGLDNILVVSLGTGSLTHKYPYDHARNWGLVGWVRPLLNITLDGSSESVAVQLEQLLPKAQNQPSQYYRFQAFLSSRNEAMDIATPENIEELQKVAHLILGEKNRELDELCQQLLEPSPP